MYIFIGLSTYAIVRTTYNIYKFLVTLEYLFTRKRVLIIGNMLIRFLDNYLRLP
jgi:hypothetical protein